MIDPIRINVINHVFRQSQTFVSYIRQIVYFPFGYVLHQAVERLITPKFSSIWCRTQ